MAELRLSSGLVAVLDDADLTLVQGFAWYSHQRTRSTYVRANTKSADGVRGGVLMHRIITAAPAGALVDHRNGDGLDNRRENLRVCDRTGNNRNARLRRDSTTGYKGVSFFKRQQRFIAYINADGAREHLGYFDSAEEAALAYNAAAVRLHGEYALLNLIERREAS